MLDTMKVQKFIDSAVKHPKAARFALQSIAYALLPNERIRVCQRVRIPDRAVVDVYWKPAINVEPGSRRGSARYGGLMRCGLGWVCALCAMRLGEMRRAELNRAFETARFKYEPFMVTLTARHNRGDSLKRLLTGLTESYRYMAQQRSWRAMREEHGIVGAVRATEITYSEENGWHPHFHVIVFVGVSAVGDKDERTGKYIASKDDKEYYADVMRQRMIEHWLPALVHHGLDASEANGVCVHPGSYVAYYVTKYGEWDMGAELTAHYRKETRSKEGMTVWEMLVRAWAGDEKSPALFKEYHQATKGKSQLQWSTGLRDLLKSPETVTDDQIRDEITPQEILLTTLTPDEWRLIVMFDKMGEALDLCAGGEEKPLRDMLIDLYHREHAW